MAKNIKTTDDLYSCIKYLAEKKNVKINDLLDMLVENIHNNSEDKILLNDYDEFSSILIEDTGLFNYKGGQSCVYNRLKDSNVHTLQDLFRNYDLRRLEYGDKKLNNIEDYIYVNLIMNMKNLNIIYLNCIL